MSVSGPCSDVNREHIALVCVDENEASVQMLNWYLNRIHRSNHKILLLHIYDNPQPRTQSLIYPAQSYDNYQMWKNGVRERSTLIIKKFQEKCVGRGLECEGVVIENVGTVGQTICDLARDKGAELIVVGHSSGGKYLGTSAVSEHVLKNTKTYVLIAPM